MFLAALEGFLDFGAHLSARFDPSVDLVDPREGQQECSGAIRVSRLDGMSKGKPHVVYVLFDKT